MRMLQIGMEISILRLSFWIGPFWPWYWVTCYDRAIVNYMLPWTVDNWWDET